MSGPGYFNPDAPLEPLIGINLKVMKALIGPKIGMLGWTQVICMCDGAH